MCFSLGHLKITIEQATVNNYSCPSGPCHCGGKAPVYLPELVKGGLNGSSAAHFYGCEAGVSNLDKLGASGGIPQPHTMRWSFAFSLFIYANIYILNREIIIYSLICSCFYGNSIPALGEETKSAGEMAMFESERIGVAVLTAVGQDAGSRHMLVMLRVPRARLWWLRFVTPAKAKPFA